MLAIICGSFLGLGLKRGIPNQAKDTIMQGMGLMTIVIGLKMALSSDQDILIIVSLILGGVIGEIAHLDKRLNHIGITIKDKLHVKDNNFVDGFVSASLIFCVGAMAIVGSIEALSLIHIYPDFPSLIRCIQNSKDLTHSAKNDYCAPSDLLKTKYPR